MSVPLFMKRGFASTFRAHVYLPQCLWIKLLGLRGGQDSLGASRGALTDRRRLRQALGHTLTPFSHVWVCVCVVFFDTLAHMMQCQSNSNTVLAGFCTWTCFCCRLKSRSTSGRRPRSRRMPMRVRSATKETPKSSHAPAADACSEYCHHGTFQTLN